MLVFYLREPLSEVHVFWLPLQLVLLPLEDHRLLKLAQAAQQGLKGAGKRNRK